MKRLYLYLASRSKQGVKVITVLQGQERVASKLTDLTNLKLPQTWERRISQIIHDNRMLYEPMIESASNFEELKNRLKAKGYTNLPMGGSPMLDLAGYVKAPMADTSSCQVQRTMLRKKT